MKPRTKVGQVYHQNTEEFSEIMKMFVPVEGQVSFYYGRIRNGKTYAATADILDLLKRGEIVYANWMVKFDGFDERDSFKHVLVKSFFGRKDFFYYSPENFHYFHPDDIDVALLGKLVNVHIFIDEGQWIFNSHVRNPDEEKRKLILHNGHYCRSLNIISQRPSNVFKDMRSQVNVWYKCEKRLSFPFLLFERTTYEDMKEDMPDEENPSGHKIYFAKKEVYEAYNTHAMRGTDAIDEPVAFNAYETSLMDRLYLLISFMVPARFRKERPDGRLEEPGSMKGEKQALDAKFKPSRHMKGHDPIDNYPANAHETSLT